MEEKQSRSLGGADFYAQSAHEDIEEGVSRMMDEGGGVVDQNNPPGAPILRNHLVDIPESPSN